MAKNCDAKNYNSKKCLVAQDGVEKFAEALFNNPYTGRSIFADRIKAEGSWVEVDLALLEKSKEAKLKNKKMKQLVEQLLNGFFATQK